MQVRKKLTSIATRLDKGDSQAEREIAYLAYDVFDPRERPTGLEDLKQELMRKPNAAQWNGLEQSLFGPLVAKMQIPHDPRWDRLLPWAVEPIATVVVTAIKGQHASGLEKGTLILRAQEQLLKVMAGTGGRVGLLKLSPHDHTFFAYAALWLSQEAQKLLESHR